MLLPVIYINLLKAALAFGFTGISAAIIGYWWRARWWKTMIGIAIQLERLCLILLWAVVMSSVFLNLNRYNSEILAWFQLGLLFLEGVAHWFLFGVFERVHQLQVRSDEPLTRRRRLWQRLLWVRPSE